MPTKHFENHEASSYKRRWEATIENCVDVERTCPGTSGRPPCPVNAWQLHCVAMLNYKHRITVAQGWIVIPNCLGQRPHLFHEITDHSLVPEVGDSYASWHASSTTPLSPLHKAKRHWSSLYKTSNPDDVNPTTIIKPMRNHLPVLSLLVGGMQRKYSHSSISSWSAFLR